MTYMEDLGWAEVRPDQARLYFPKNRKQRKALLQWAQERGITLVERLPSRGHHSGHYPYECAFGHLVSSPTDEALHTRGYRRCRACEAERSKQRRDKKKMKGLL